MEKMTLQEALNSVKQMKTYNPAMAFATIEEILDVAAGLEKNIEELELKKSLLQSEIAELENKKDELTPLVEELREKLRQKGSILSAVENQFSALKAKII